MMLLRIGLILGLFLTSRADDETSDEKKSLNYQTPVFNNLDTYFIETFDDASEFSHTWVKSRAKKDNTDEALAKYDGVWDLEQPTRDALHGDFGLVLKSKAKHAAIAAKLKRPFVFMNKPFIVQYEVLLQEGQECGGAYLKLLSVDKASSDLTKFHDRTPYTIMFGPDKCGNDHKLHFIFRHKNPKTGNFEEKHCKKPTERIEDYFIDKKPHLYTLILNPDNSFKIYIDHNLVNSGSLLEDFTPEVNPPAEIDDPNDKKPADWDDREKVPDTTATKPENWDDDAPKTIEDPSAKKPEGWLDNEPLNIRDPFAAKPDDWDDDMDGEWEAPLVPNPACEDAPGCGKWSPPTIINPAYKGKWLPPMIDNPNYQGKWAPKRIPNPDYFEDKFPFRMSSIEAVGFELWSMSPNILFDNIVITDKLEIAEELAMKTFDLKKKIMELDADTFIGRFINYTNKHPWLWAVYVVVLLIPITLIVIFCFGTSAKERDTLDADAARKKDDQVSPDDPVSEEQDEAQSNVESMVSYFNSEEKGEEEEDSEDSSNENKGDTAKDQDIDQQHYQVLEDSDIEEQDNAEDASEDDGIFAPDPSPRKRCQRID